ncbi:hypothetical protein PhaeoP23_03958 (plasmid) [Phaeobacter piscinae]|uniref:Uncharacterized protein n=1 Tax=Phaeobacter piscinae TaxID=1580596 RepID=A0ABN5DKV8_9RHOB|nr:MULTISPECIES: hypothetical protein [Phaeobacter]ATG38111.1 hypothetical protein PhaeoP36_04036 [Phaeobacter piscinae]AUQ88632.1 hypothetical protein PhaeoP42_04037 [Phaeobacter piscinae]AUQ92631.1 hypothetical protein PhaeoP24_04073 [Phaeobacter inhibens]AUR26437.1 hypothetical protein PhaeoP23_03958 [Phaeobacter piscinae]
MSKIAEGLHRTWRAAQLYVGFHKDQSGKQREAAKLWPPRNGNATIHQDPTQQEAFVVVKASDQTENGDVQIKLRPDQIVLRRDPSLGWQGIKVDDYEVAIQVNDVWVRIKADGSISHDRDGNLTFIEADGAVLKVTEGVEAMMSGDGVELSRRTPSDFAAIRTDGVISKAR